MRSSAAICTRHAARRRSYSAPPASLNSVTRACAIRAWWRANAAARARALAPALALAAMCFPLDTHLAFYSAWWGLLFWWLLALYCAALGAEDAAHA